MSSIATMDLAALARNMLADHTQWDGPHQFAAITWDGTVPRIAALAIIAPDVHPTAYPAMMAMSAAEWIAVRPPAVPIAAFALLFESYAVEQPTAMTEMERLQFEADRRGRTFHQRDDAIEQAGVFIADVTGRMWSAIKRRDQPGTVHEAFRPNRDTTGDGVLTGAFIDALDACALLAARALAVTDGIL